MTKAEKWHQEVEDYLKSGLMQKDWCKARGIAKGTFCYQLKKFRETKTSQTFFELKQERSSIKMQWKKLVIELDSGFDEQTVFRLLCIIDKFS